MAIFSKYLDRTSCAFILCACGSLCATQPNFFYEIDPNFHDDPWQQALKISEVIYQGKTDFQEVFVFDNPEFGRVLVLDNLVQTTEMDEYAYHEMLNQVPLLAHDHPKRVLIIGGGDGGSLREVLLHDSVEKVTMVDIDGQVVELCRKYLPDHSAGAFEDPRVTLLIQDGFEFVKNTPEKFDVIICDSTDPVGPGKILFSSEFYGNCKRILNEDGILVAQNSVPFSYGEVIPTSYNNLSPYFDDVRFYVTSVPTYIGGFMTFSFSTNSPKYAMVSEKTLQERVEHLGRKMKYYSPEVHKAAFALPRFIKDLIPPK